jgi:hypothetical protein
MTPRDRWKEIEVILNSAVPKEEAKQLVALLKESVKYEIDQELLEIKSKINSLE